MPDYEPRPDAQSALSDGSGHRRSWLVRFIELLVRWRLRLAGTAPVQQPPSPTDPPPPDAPPPEAPPPQASAPETHEPASSTGEAAGPAPAVPPAAPLNLIGDAYEAWILENEPDAGGLALQRRLSADFSWRPKISVLTPVYKVPIAVLRETVDSVLAQTYDNWELCLAHGDVDDAAARAYLEGAAAADSRIKVKLLDRNEGIAGNSNQALPLVTGEFLALLDHDDTLAPFALFETAKLLNDDPQAGFIYSDKDYLSELNFQRVHPLFKPEWSPDMMLNANYVTHLCIMRTEHVRAVGGWRVETDGAQDWDLFLRVIARGGHVRHIPKVLYHWRQIASSVAMSGLASKPYAPPAQVRTVQDYCKQVGLDVEVTYDPVGGPHLHWKNAASIKASIIFLSRNPSPESIANAKRLRTLTSYPDFEVLLAVDEDCLDSEVRCVRVSTPDLSERIRYLAAASSGQALVFIDEAVTPAAADWLAELVGPLQDSGIGMVGAKLLDAGTNCLRHAGIVFSNEGRPEYVFSGQPDHRSNEFGHASWYRDCSAVGGACFSIGRQAWEAIGGLRHPARYPRLDVQIALDLKLRTGLRIVYNPYARLYQNGPAALEQNLWPEDDAARSYILSLFPGGDPFLSPNLECRNGEIYVKRRHSDGNAQPRAN